MGVGLGGRVGKGVTVGVKVGSGVEVLARMGSGVSVGAAAITSGRDNFINVGVGEDTFIGVSTGKVPSNGEAVTECVVGRGEKSLLGRLQPANASDNTNQTRKWLIFRRAAFRTVAMRSRLALRIYQRILDFLPDQRISFALQ